MNRSDYQCRICGVWGKGMPDDDTCLACSRGEIIEAQDQEILALKGRLQDMTTRWEEKTKDFQNAIGERERIAKWLEESAAKDKSLIGVDGDPVRVQAYYQCKMAIVEELRKARGM